MRKNGGNMKITREKAKKLLGSAAISQAEQQQAEIAEKLDISAGIFMSALENTVTEPDGVPADETENGPHARDRAFFGARPASLEELREDTVTECGENVRERIMSQAPMTENGCFAVPKTVD